MDDGQQLLLTFDAKFERYLRNFERAQQQTDQRFRSMERRAKETGDRMERSLAASALNMGRSMSTIALALGGSAFVRGAQHAVDEATRIRNSLKSAGLEGDALNKVYARLFKSAQQNAAPIGALADLYAKVSINQKELGVSTEEMLAFTDHVALALRVAGTDARAASGSLLQLSQALGSGVVRAEEFNSILEGTPTIARTVAIGLREAGGSVAELRKLVVDGKLSSEAFFRAFEAGSVSLQQQAESSTITISQAFTRLGNSLIDAAGKFDRATGASAKFADGITALADAISSFDVSSFIGKIDEAMSAVERFLNSLGNAQVFKDFNQWMGLVDKHGNAINPDFTDAEAEARSLQREVDALQATIENNSELGIDNTEALARLEEVKARLAEVLAMMDALPATLPNPASATAQLDRRIAARDARDSEAPASQPAATAIEQVSIADYAAPTTASKGGRRRGGGGGGRGGDAYTREIADIERRTAALRAETEARRDAGGSLENQSRAAERAKMIAELLNAAQSSGVTITDSVRNRIDRLADAYVTASAEAQNLARSQEEAASTAQELASLAGSAISGLVKDLIAGKDPGEAFANMLAGIADKLIDLIIQMLIVKPLMSLFGFSGGGLVGGSGMGLFASGGYTGHGGKYEPAGVVHRGEYVLTKEATSRIGVSALDALNYGHLPGFAAGGMVGDEAPRTVSRLLGSANDNAPAVQINAPITVNGSAGTPEQNEDLARRMKRELEGTMRGLVADEFRKAQRPGNLGNNRMR